FCRRRCADSSPSSNTRNSISETRKSPLISLAILRRAIGDEITSVNPKELSSRVYAGVLLKDNKK
ncbi:hypothetical protein ACJRO7_005560, partial [Eucalyptus globulus]